MSKRKAQDSLAEVSKDGKFVRTDSNFRHIIGESDKYPVEANRYHLYICNACPWANRTNAVRLMKGLKDIIGLSVTHPTWQKTRPDDDEDGHHGWAFANEGDPPFTPPSGVGSIPCKDVIPDTINHHKFVRDIYESVDDNQTKYTVPLLYDKKTNTIVNNESSEILRMFNNSFAKLVGSDKTTQDLYPKHLKKQIDDINEWIYHDINNGVYKCGFAKSQSAYDTAVDKLYIALNKVENILSKSRYLVSNTEITEADIRLFMTLIRFDEVYVVYFKTNIKLISSYTNINNYLRELYQLPWIKESVNMNHIKQHYFTSHPTLNTYSVIPKGPNVIQDMLKPHDRDRKW